MFLDFISVNTSIEVIRTTQKRFLKVLGTENRLGGISQGHLKLLLSHRSSYLEPGAEGAGENEIPLWIPPDMIRSRIKPPPPQVCMKFSPGDVHSGTQRIKTHGF